MFKKQSVQNEVSNIFDQIGQKANYSKTMFSENQAKANQFPQKNSNKIKTDG